MDRIFGLIRKDINFVSDTDNMLKNNSKVGAILLIIFLLVFPHFSGLPYYSYAIVCFVLLLLYLKFNRWTLRDIGLRKNGINAKLVITGILSGLLWVVFIQWVYVPLIQYLFHPPPYTEYNFIQNKFPALVFTLAASWIVGGFYEELVFRGFLQTTFMKWLAGSRYSFWLAAIITSILFGLYHIQQGLFGVIPAMLGSMYWSLLLRRSKGNLWAVIFSHATYDTVVLIMIYFGVFG